MLFYVGAGMVVGIIIGYWVAPGYFFWFLLGALCGYLLQQVLGHRY